MLLRELETHFVSLKLILVKSLVFLMSWELYWTMISDDTKWLDFWMSLSSWDLWASMTTREEVTLDSPRMMISVFHSHNFYLYFQFLTDQAHIQKFWLKQDERKCFFCIYYIIIPEHITNVKIFILSDNFMAHMKPTRNWS